MRVTCFDFRKSISGHTILEALHNNGAGKDRKLDSTNKNGSFIRATDSLFQCQRQSWGKNFVKLQFVLQETFKKIYRCPVVNWQFWNAWTPVSLRLPAKTEPKHARNSNICWSFEMWWCSKCRRHLNYTYLRGFNGSSTTLVCSRLQSADHVKALKWSEIELPTAFSVKLGLGIKQ